MKLKIQTLLLLAISSGLIGLANADLVATDLNTGGTDTGFSGGWAGSGNRFIITASDLTYSNYGIAQTGTVQRVYGGNSSHPDRMDSRDLAVTMSGEIWFSVLVDVPAGGGFAGLSLHSDTLAQQGADYSHNQADLRVVMSPSELWVDWQGGGVNASWTPDATVGGFSAGTHLILGQMTVGVGTDTLNVWVDPDLTSVAVPGDLPAATYSDTTTDFTDSIVRIGVPLNVSGLDTADAIWLSDTATAFEDVTGVGTTDTTPPELAAVDPLSPADDAIDVPVVTSLMATFDETILLGTGFIRIRESIGDALVEEFDVETSGNLALDGLSVTIDPGSNLTLSTGYYVQIDATAIKDFAGNNFAGIADTTTWNFNTTSDTTPPIATIDSPANGATEVVIDSTLTLTFDENVKAGAGNILIKRTSDDTVVDTIAVTGGNVTIVDNQVTIIPTADLPELSGLYVEIDSGAFLDLLDNPFAGISGSATWSFTTGGIPPVVVAADLNDGGTDTGFDGGFYNGSNNVFIIDAPDLTYANYSITQTGTTQRVYASNAGPDRQDLRNLATPMSGEIWFSALVHVPAGSNYAGLTFNSYGNSYDPITTAARILMGPTQLQVGFNGGAASTGSGTYSSDTTHLLLGQMIVGAGNDTLNVWVDPNVLFSGTLPTADFSETAVDFADSITILGVAGSKGAGSDVLIDAIRLSNTPTAFTDVAGVAANAAITSFEAAGAAGVIDAIAKTIALEVPFGTDLATLAPTYTLSSGTCDQPNDGTTPPSPTFAAQNPVDYVVTDTSTDPDTVNTYSVTVTVAPETTTLVIDLGTSPAGTTIEGGTFIGSGPTNLPLPALPAGSILKSIAVDAVLEATDTFTWASDLSVLLDPTPGTPGGDFSVEITNGTSPLGGAALNLDWPASADAGIGTGLIDTKTDADWAAAGPIDLATTGLFLGNTYDTAPGEATWSGTITLSYFVVPGGGNDFSDWIAGFDVDGQTALGDDPDGDGNDNGVENFFGTDPGAFSQGLVAGAVDTGANTFTFTHPLNATPADDLTATYRWSTDLQTFHDDGAANGAGTTTVDFAQGAPSGGMVTVTATISGSVVPDKLFVGIKVTQAE